MGIKNNSYRSSAEGQSILVVGADGMIGRSLVATLEHEGKSVFGSTRKQTRITESRVFIDLAEAGRRPLLPRAKITDAVLCAASTSMERCRLEPIATREINVKNTVALAKLLVAEGVNVVFLSSNTVFDGQTPFPKATDRTSPQTEYGRQKAEAEQQLLSLGEQVAVVRFSKVISPSMPLLTGWASDLRAGKVVHPFKDSVMAPVSVAFAVELVVRVLEHRLTGIIQASASNDISYEQAAKYLAAKLGAESRLIESISYLQMGLPVFPKNTTLDASRLKELRLEAPPAANALDQLKLAN